MARTRTRSRRVHKRSSRTKRRMRGGSGSGGSGQSLNKPEYCKNKKVSIASAIRNARYNEDYQKKLEDYQAKFNEWCEKAGWDDEPKAPTKK